MGHLAPMAYADLKNDVVFRKVFGQHPEVLIGLLNDLLDRSGDQAIKSLEYLPSDQAPVVPGAKLSILDVKCREVGGAVFVVEMQILKVTAFMNRVVYNACKAYVGTLLRGRGYSTLTDVVAVSVCDFELWSDAERDRTHQPRVPLVSRWSMAEHATGVRSLGQVQYLFCELPKLRDHRPETAAERWAALFAAAPLLDAATVASEPFTAAQRSALELCREETFTPQELDAIERAFEEVDQFRRTVVAEAEKAHDVGVEVGQLREKRAMLLRLTARRGLTLTDAQKARVEECTDRGVLDRWIDRAMEASSADDVVE